VTFPKILSMSATRPSILIPLLSLALFACNGGADSKQDTTAAAGGQMAPTSSADAPIMVRGSVVSVSDSQLVLKFDTGNVSVRVTQPFHLYTRAPSDLAHVTDNTFIGVTTVKQADGSERATEIHVFPEELRGLGEGSRMMNQQASTSGSRMTNGSVSGSRMTNGSASRMTNGSVGGTNGSTLVVQYAGGSQTVTVPPNTPVTELKLSTKKVAPGDQIAVLAQKAADGSLTADKAVSTAK
jgi:hypothetical protein